MPNSLAFMTMTLWPFVTLAMYLMLPARTAVIWSILAGYLLLPAGMTLDLPGVPGMTKQNVPAVFGYFFASAMLGRLIPLVPKGMPGRILVGLLLLGPVFTIVTNGDPVYIGNDTVLPGLRPYDAASMIVNQFGFLSIWALSREVLSDRTALRQLVTAFVIAFLWYSLPMLYEVRMSPQLHTQIYGFFPHNFLQMMRQGGFRPIVFLEHGLWIAILTSMAVMLAVVLARDAAPGRKLRWYAAAFYLLIVLVLCKSLAALLYAVLLMPMLLLFSGRRLAQIAVLMGVLVLSYPLLRSFDVIPTDSLVETVAESSPERAQSLEFRFVNEDMLLSHAMQRPLFGWGGWGRNSVYDPQTGENISTTDGLWIIAMGYGGYAGFIGQFGLLLLPIFMLTGAYRRTGQEVSVFAAGVAVVLAVNLVDLLPNATITPVTWLFSGAMLGYLENLRRGEVGTRTAAAAAVPARARPRFSGLVGQPVAGPRTLV